MELSRYLLFGGDFYYPSGGWFDFVKSSDDRLELMVEALESDKDWAHIVDMEANQRIWMQYFDDED